MPFGLYGTTEDALHNAVKLMQAGAHMVKVEGGAWLAETVRRLVSNGIPVCAHLGLTPQSVFQLGGFKVQAKTNAAADQLLQDALLCRKPVRACYALRLCRCIVGKFRHRTRQDGHHRYWRGQDTDGQGIVLYDMLDVFPGKKPNSSKLHAG